MTTTAAYGTWTSPITSDLIVSQAIGLGGAKVDGETLYWTEARPTEGGRIVLVRRNDDGTTTDMTPPPFYIRTRVHEYGGSALAIEDGVIVFANFADQRLYRIEGEGDPVAITPEGGYRYADFVFDSARGRLIAVREDHSGEGEAVNTIVAIDLGGDDTGGTVLASGHDFHAAPRLSPDGRTLAWITWDHPFMPWDETELWTAALDDSGTPGEPVLIAGGPGESVVHPRFSPAGALHFASDRTGWWNLYRQDGAQTTPLCEMEAEFGRPLWSLGIETYRFLEDGRLVCTWQKDGEAHLGFLDDTGLAPIQTPFDASSLPTELGERWIMSGAWVDRPDEIVSLDPDGGEIESIRASAALDLDPALFSRPEAIEFPTERGLSAYAYFYAPANPDFDAPAGELPPLMVRSHGGPTAPAGNMLNLQIQYWTSRGFAVVDVNYGGSTGFGREFRDRLKGMWGVIDIEDCVNAALWLVAEGRADGERLCIRGGSAGGYTTLAALTFRDVFRAGASLFGVGDLMALARDTHKFESRYMDQMVGPADTAAGLYHDRSPIHFTDQLDCPVIFFQGLDDKVVPPAQAETMVAALDAKGVPVAYMAFEGEGHGFRRAENIKASLEAELAFYGRIFGFEPADDLRAPEIRNL